MENSFFDVTNRLIGIKIRLNHLPPNSLNKDFCSSSIFLVSFGYNLSVESNLISSNIIFSSLPTLTKVVMKDQQLLVPDQLWWPSLEYTKATFFHPSSIEAFEDLHKSSFLGCILLEVAPKKIQKNHIFSLNPFALGIFCSIQHLSNT